MAIRISLGGIGCLDPVEEARNLADHGKPVPADFARANSISNPAGREAARGWFLVRRKDLNGLNFNGYLSLVLSDGTSKVTVAGLVVSKEPLNLTPSVRAQSGDGAFLVEVADSRWLARNPYFQVSIDAQYNVRAPAYGGNSGAGLYYEDSLNAGVVWTWQTMVQDIWGLLPMLGAAPSLPYAPDGIPEGWVFPGVSAWDSLCDVLERINCEVIWNWQSGTYSIVRVGDADSGSAAIIAGSSVRKIHDAEYQPIVFGREPAIIRVKFHRRELYAGAEETNTRTAGASWQTIHSHDEDVAGSVLAAPGTIHALWDDLPALYDAGGSLVNGADCATRAAERAGQYLAALRSPGGTRLHQTYSGLLLLDPGSTVKGVSWRQRQTMPDGEGDFVTEVVRHPFRSVKVGDDGQFVPRGTSSEPVQAPNFGPQWPVYPITDQIIKINNIDSTFGGLYDCLLEKAASPVTFSDKDAVWGLDLAGLAGDLNVARLICNAIANEVQTITLSATGGYWLITGVTEVQTITLSATGGYWLITGSATHLAWNETAVNVQTVVQAVTGLAVIVTGPDGGPYTLTWPAPGSHALLMIDDTNLTGDHQYAFIEETSSGKSGSATHLAYNETPANVQTAARAVTGLLVVVTGSNGGPYTITWPDDSPHGLLDTDATNLTGGASTATAVEAIEGGWRPVYAFRSSPGGGGTVTGDCTTASADTAILASTATTCDIYRLGNAPPAAPDVAAVSCQFEGDYRCGLAAGQTMSSSYRFHYVMLVPLSTDIQDGYNDGSTTDADTVFIPNSSGTMYRVRFVERTAWGTLGDKKRVYLSRDATPWPTNDV